MGGVEEGDRALGYIHFDSVERIDEQTPDSLPGPVVLATTQRNP